MPPSDEQLPSAFFHVDGDLVVPTVLCRGPWDPGTAHGGPVAALVGRSVERFDPDPDLMTVRITLELVRPVPLAPLEVEATTLRAGGRVRLIGVSVRHDGVEVTRAVALRIRRVPDPVGGVSSSPSETLTPPEELPVVEIPHDDVGCLDGLELRAVQGFTFAVGPATCWFRVRVPLVDDEPVTPLTRALIPADFGNGISSVLSHDTHVFINPDLTVHLHRLPEGEWVGNRAVTHLEPGAGSRADADLFDPRGQLGRATQALYVAAL